MILPTLGCVLPTLQSRAKRCHWDATESDSVVSMSYFAVSTICQRFFFSSLKKQPFMKFSILSLSWAKHFYVKNQGFQDIFWLHIVKIFLGYILSRHFLATYCQDFFKTILTLQSFIENKFRKFLWIFSFFQHPNFQYFHFHKHEHIHTVLICTLH